MIALFILLLTCGTVLAQSPAQWIGSVVAPRRPVAATESQSGQTYLLEEGFEGANSGYDLTGWTEAGTGTIDQDGDNTGLGMGGAQCLHLVTSTSTANTTHAINGVAETVVKFLFRAHEAGSGTLFLSLRNATPATVLSVNITSSTKLNVAGGSANVTTANAISLDTTYYIWVHHRSGSGANGFISVGFSTTDSEPTSGGNYVSASNDNGTTQAVWLRLGPYVNVTSDIYFDNVQVYEP